MLTLHKDSHLDHGLSERAIGYILGRFHDRDGFFIETFELPEDMGTLECGLHGPIMGDAPVTVDNAVVWYEKRGTREYKSRLCARPKRQTRTVTVIAGPHDGQSCVLYTVYGGPCAPREPADIRKEMEKLHDERAGLHDMSEEYKTIQAKIEALRVKRTESDAFWGEHALSG